MYAENYKYRIKYTKKSFQENGNYFILTYKTYNNVGIQIFCNFNSMKFSQNIVFE